MRSVLCILILGLYLPLFAPTGYGEYNMKAEKEESGYEELWRAVCFVESSNVHDTINFNEMAYGIAQIRDIRIRDYNQRTGETLTLEDCLDSANSRRVFMYYAEKLGDWEKVARRWNGSGSKTDIYWEKIQKQLNN